MKNYCLGGKIRSAAVHVRDHIFAGFFTIALFIATPALQASSVQFTSQHFTINESLAWGGPVISFTPRPTGPVRVTISATGGTAQWPDDYSSNRIELEIPLSRFSDNNTNIQLPIGVVDDGKPETDETLQFEIVSVQGAAALGDAVRATVTIQNSAPRLEFQVYPRKNITYRTENQSFAFNVMRTGDTNVAVAFDCEILTNSSAIAGVDFVRPERRIVVEPGERSKEFVELLDDGVVESPKSLQVSISPVSQDVALLGEGGVTLAEPKLLCIIDDDETPSNLDLHFSPEFVKRPHFGSIHPTQVTVQPDGKILLFGPGLYLGVTQVSVLRLHADGTPDYSFRAAVRGNVSRLDLAPGGKVFVVSSPGGILRLLSTGAVDPTFSFSSSQSRMINDLIVQPDGKPLLTIINGDQWNLIRLNSNGAIDPSWNFQAGPTFNTERITPLDGGKFLRCGNSIDSFVRLNSDGSVDNTFVNPLTAFVTPDSPRFIAHLAKLKGGRILVQLNSPEAGSWDTGTWVPDRSPRDTRIVFLRPDGAFDLDVLIREPLVQYSYYSDSWATRFLAEIDGYLYFTANETGRNGGPCIVRLRPDGTLDTSFSVRPSDYNNPYGWNSYGGPRGEIPSASPHQDALLCWTADYDTVNGTRRVLARILVKDAPESQFTFRGDPPPSYETGFSARETDGEARIRVFRTGNVTQGAQVSYSTTDGTARAGEDYEAVTGVLNFAPMEKEKTIVVRLLSSPDFRRTPHYFVVLGEPSSPAVVDQPAKIHILDQEIGLVPKNVLRRLNGSLELLYRVSDHSPPSGEQLFDGRFLRVERSSDFREWKRVEHGNTDPPYQIIFSPSDAHGFLRLRKD